MPYIQLKPHQYQQLTDAITDAFPTMTELTQFLLFNFGLKVNELEGDTLSGKVIAMILTLESSEQIFELLDKAIQTNSTNAKLQKAKADIVPSTIQAGIDHFNVCFINEERPFINRTFLREKLKTMIESDFTGKRILVVNGDPKSGKSYSFQMISYLYQALGKFKFVWIDLSQTTGTVEPDYIASRIVNRIRLSENVIPPVGQEQDTRWIQSFCDRLEGEIENVRDDWWIIIDGFNQQWKLSDSTNLLIHELGQRIRFSLMGLRMILIGYKGLPVDMETAVIKDEIEPINDRDLVEFFAKVNREKQKNMTPDDIAAKVAEVLRAVDPSSPRRLEMIGKEVARVCQTI